MATQEVVNRSVNVFIQSGQAQKVYDTLIAKEKQLNDELTKTADPKKIQALNNELNKLSEPISRAAKKLSGELAPSLRDNQALAKQLNNELGRQFDPAKAKQLQQLNGLIKQQRVEINGLSEAQKSIGTGSIFSGAFLAGAAATGLSKIKEFVTGSLEEFEQADLAIRNLENDLSNIGDVKSLPQLTEQADALAEKFKFLDNDDIINAQDKLVTYGKLSSAEIQKLIPVIIDYAAKTRQTVPEAADVFIKALEGQSKGLKNFGIRVNEANGVTKNMTILTTDLANKVRGAANAFGESSTGKIASWKQAIKNAQETLGRFIATIIEGPKSADQLFDIAKKQSDQVNDRLTPLIAKYDELKAKTTLNKDEQSLLQGVIAKIVEIVPLAATEFDKYGNALDINKAKVIAFKKENDSFLQTREKKAIDALLEQANEAQQTLDLFVNNQKVINRDAEKNKLSQENLAKANSLLNTSIAKAQDDVIAVTDKLIDKFKVKLPEALQATRDAALKTKFSIDEANAALSNVSGSDKKNQEQTLEVLKAQLKDLQTLLETLPIASQKFKDTQLEIARVQKLIDDATGKTFEDAAKKAEEAAKKILDDFKKLGDELNGLKLTRQGEASSPMDKEIADLIIKFDKLKELAHGNRDKLKQIDTEYYEQLFQLQLKYSRLELQEEIRLNKEKEQNAQALINKLTAAGLQTSTSDKLKGIFDLVAQDSAAKVELDILNAKGEKKLDLQKAQLKKEEDAEVLSIENMAAARGASENTVLNMIALTRAQFRKRELELEIQHYAEVANQIGAVVQQAFQAVQQIAQIQTDHENAELQADADRNKKKEENLDNRLKAGLDTQLAHDRAVAQIEKNQEKREKEVKEKQFRRNQAMSIIQTQINGAMAAINALTVQPFYVGIALAAIAAASTIAEVAYIRGQKPPDFGNGGLYGDGGKTTGRSHTEGGNPIIDGRTGRKIGEIEHDEGIINKRSMRDRSEYTVSGTVSQIGSLLNRLHGGIHWEPGGRLTPAWRTVQPSRINIPNIQRYYAAGGTFTASTAGQVNSSNQVGQAKRNEEVNSMLISTLHEMKDTIGSLQSTVDRLDKKGIKAYTVLSEQEAQQDRIAAIRSDATLKG